MKIARIVVRKIVAAIRIAAASANFKGFSFSVCSFFMV